MNLKPITRDGIPNALRKVERYRLLNDAVAAESICLDVLDVDPENQEALDALEVSAQKEFDGRLRREARESIAQIRSGSPDK